MLILWGAGIGLVAPSFIEEQMEAGKLRSW